MERLQGWECPRCHAVLAPFMPFCTNCRDNETGSTIDRVYPSHPSDRNFKHPCQFIEKDKHGRVRFIENKIVGAMLDYGRRGQKFDLNSLCDGEFDKNDWRQFAQLIGYSINGFFELSYVVNTWGYDEYNDGYEEYVDSILERMGLESLENS